MAYRNCLENHLTEGCKGCACWSDKDNYKGFIGCGYPGPIMHCEFFAEMWNEDAKRDREQNQKKGDLCNVDKKDN